MSTQSVLNFRAKLSNFRLSKFEKVVVIKDSEKKGIFQDLQLDISKKVKLPKSNFKSKIFNLFKMYLK